MEEFYCPILYNKECQRYHRRKIGRIISEGIGFKKDKLPADVLLEFLLYHILKSYEDNNAQVNFLLFKEEHWNANVISINSHTDSTVNSTLYNTGGSKNWKIKQRKKSKMWTEKTLNNLYLIYNEVQQNLKGFLNIYFFR